MKIQNLIKKCSARINRGPLYFINNNNTIFLRKYFIQSNSKYKLSEKKPWYNNWDQHIELLTDTQQAGIKQLIQHLQRSRPLHPGGEGHPRGEDPRPLHPEGEGLLLPHQSVGMATCSDDGINLNFHANRTFKWWLKIVERHSDLGLKPNSTSVQLRAYKMQMMTCRHWPCLLYF